MKCYKCNNTLLNYLDNYSVTFEDGHTEFMCAWCFETIYDTKQFWFRKHKKEKDFGTGPDNIDKVIADVAHQYWFFNTKEELVNFIKKTYSKDGYDLVIYVDVSMWTTYDIYLAKEGVLLEYVGNCSLNIKIGEDFDEYWHYRNTKQLKK